MLVRVFIGVALVGVIIFIALQFMPYGRAHVNPPTQAEPKWDSAQTRALATRACFDCHSNETEWPWYSNVAPFSWLIQHDVEEGRAKLNFSQWNQPQREARGAGREVQRGTMPQWYYILLHPSAKLSSDETKALIQGLNATLGGR